MAPQDSPPTEPLAVFGGTFDPVHYGHLRCAEEARRKLGLQSLCLLPAGSPVHRDPPGATAAQRLEMLRLAVREFPQLQVDDREIRRAGPSYMYDTLLELRAECGRRPLLLLIGQDAANGLDGWRRWQDLFSLAHVVILTRPGQTADYPPDLGGWIQERRVDEPQAVRRSPSGGVLYLAVTPVDVSATVIKEMLRRGRSPRSMLPGAVLRYIGEQRLYGSC